MVMSRNRPMLSITIWRSFVVPEECRFDHIALIGHSLYPANFGSRLCSLIVIREIVTALRGTVLGTFVV